MRLSELAFLTVFLLGMRASEPTRHSAELAKAQVSASERGAESCSITGLVLRSGTNEPIRGVRVILTKADGPSTPALITVADTAGRFSIGNVEAGSYHMRLERSGYVKQTYGQGSRGVPGATLNLSPGQNVTDLVFRLKPAAVIAGQVRDENGEPLANSTVQAFQLTSFQGKTETKRSGLARTNDLGEYRIFDLAPGHYFIRADFEARASEYDEGTIVEGSIQQMEGAYIPTYFPGVSRRNSASTIEVKSGDEIPGVDITLRHTGTYKIRGRVVSSATGRAAENDAIMLVPRDSEASGEDVRTIAPEPDTGKFEIVGIAPGAYALRLMWHSERGDLNTASQSVDVSNSDLVGISLIKRAGVVVGGRIDLDGNDAAKAGAVKLVLKPNGPWVDGDDVTQAKADGSFSFSNIPDGSYSIEVQSNCDRCYLKSAVANGVDLLNGSLEVSSGATSSPIQIVYSSNSGTLEGSVTENNQSPVVGAMVELLPDESLHKLRGRYMKAATDKNGRFEIHGIAPGSYRAFAWEGVEQATDGETEFITSGKGEGQTVELDANQKKTLQLALIRSD